MPRAAYNALAALGSRTIANAPVSTAVGQGLLTVHAGAISIVPDAVAKVKPEMSTSQVFPPRLDSAACSTLHILRASLFIDDALIGGNSSRVSRVWRIEGSQSISWQVRRVLLRVCTMLHQHLSAGHWVPLGQA